MSEAASLSDTYETLSPVAQLVAQVYGVVYPYTATTARVTTILASAQFKFGGRRVQNTQAKAAGEELLKAGLVSHAEIKKELRAVRSWAPWLTLETFRNCALNGIIDAFEREQPPYWHYYNDPVRNAMRLRCFTVAGRFQDIEKNLTGIRADDWRFLAEPDAAGLLPTLPPKYLTPALTGCLSQVIETFTAPEPIIDACYELAPDLSLHIAEIAFIRILRAAWMRRCRSSMNFREIHATLNGLEPIWPPPARSSPPCALTMTKRSASSRPLLSKRKRERVNATYSRRRAPSSCPCCPCCEATRLPT